MKKGFRILGFVFLWSLAVKGQTNTSHIKDPLSVVKLIGDKLIRDTPFKYRLTVAPNNRIFNGLQFIDFGRTFTLGKPAVAYGYTALDAAQDMEMEVQIEHNDGCRIWLNGKQVYGKKGDHEIRLAYEERSVEMSGSFRLPLKKGRNDLLIKSETRGKEWRIYLQPPSTKGAVGKDMQYPDIGLENVPYVDGRIAELSNWLVIGPFANPENNGLRSGIDVVYAPENEIEFGFVYPGLDEVPVSWTIPKIEILGDVIDPLPWGTNYNWNYHNGGVAWAMQTLAEVSGEKKYEEYANNFCDFHLKGIPFVTYQVRQLNAFGSANHHIINTPLLDFTLAPSLPFINRLRKEEAFANRREYVRFIDRMLKYARDEQIRLPGSDIYTRITPEKYTTWTDDMFMGIPFLVQASKYAKDPESRRAYLDDAASQVTGFNEQVWDPRANLYMHARYFGKDIVLPHWSRANGWAIWATSELLQNLPRNHPGYKPIMQHYKAHVDALVKLQGKSGFWHNVLDRPDSPEEVSGTAIFTMALARGVNNGWLNAKKYKPVVIKAWEALKTEIETDGTVHKICMGTMCSEDENYYLNRPFYDNDTHGLFAVLFAGIEVHRMMKTIN